jgi:hypothetical protein
MSINPETEETDMFVAAYAAARNKFVELGGLTKIAPYRHIEVQSTVPVEWWMYHQMLEEHARELANELNEFGHQCCQLSAWAQVLPEYEAEDQMGLIREFVAAIATSCVSHPHTLKVRFVFSVSHLAHQVRLITDPNWKEKNLPADRQINTGTMVSIAKSSDEYIQFKKHFDELCDASYISATGQFRDKYHHRYPPRFELGITQSVTRIMKDGKTVYGFGGSEPLKLLELAPLLIAQHEKALQCFYSYSSLARQQLAEIYASANNALQPTGPASGGSSV